MSVSVDNNGTPFRSIEDMGVDDLHTVVSEPHGNVSVGTNSRVSIDYPIQTEDNEVFVVIDAGKRPKTTPTHTGGPNFGTDEFYESRYVVSSKTVDDPMNDGEEDDALVIIDEQSAFGTNGEAFYVEKEEISPSPLNPRVMPFGEGEYSCYNASRSNLDIAGPRIEMVGYVSEISNQQMTNFLRRLR